MSSFQDYGFYVYNNPETEAQSSYAHVALKDETQRESICLTPLGFCRRVIVNEKPLNLEKTTSSVLSVLLLIKCGFLLRLETLHKFT